METIQQLLEQAQAEIERCGSTAELDAVELHYLGKKGAVGALLRQIGSLPPEQRPAFGQAVNQAREQIERWLDARRTLLERAELEQRLQAERLDVTLPGVPLRPARLHPLTLTMRRVKAALMGLGFEFVEGPELEHFRYNFGALNYPEDHPAMDAQ
ncbi:MAG: phenylalanine--tRNA ligase subunit alpha, partial [Fimbriimonadales bacterium]|nr:phenylalanine--tRNA ligase subunit alpha [Fimbriimonadales bacterium]